MKGTDSHQVTSFGDGGLAFSEDSESPLELVVFHESFGFGDRLGVVFRMVVGSRVVEQYVRH